MAKFRDISGGDDAAADSKTARRAAIARLDRADRATEATRYRDTRRAHLNAARLHEGAAKSAPFYRVHHENMAGMHRRAAQNPSGRIATISVKNGVRYVAVSYTRGAAASGSTSGS